MGVRFSSSFIPAVAGVGVGAVLALVAVSTRRPGLAASSEPAPLAAGSHTAGSAATIQYVMVPASNPGVDMPGAAPSAGSAVPPPPLTPEQIKQFEISEHQAAIDAHWAETSDPEWAPKTKSLFNDDFKAVSTELEAKLVQVDCRTSSCIITAEWPNYETAVRKWRVLMDHRFATNCSTRMLLAPPQNPSLPYQATTVFGCSESRWGHGG
jgi:hypothetical protein